MSNYHNDEITTAVLMDEIQRILGDHWVDNIHLTSRRPNINNPSRSAIRNYIADEVIDFPKRPYMQHPDYTTEYPFHNIETSNTITPVELTNKVQSATYTEKSGNTIVICNNNPVNNTEVDISICTISGNIVENINDIKISTDNLQQKMLEISEDENKILEYDTNSRNQSKGENVVPDPRNEELTEEHKDILSEIILDEIKRVFGDEWVERIEEGLDQMSPTPTSIYLNERMNSDDSDEYYPPTDENVRLHARTYIGTIIRYFDDMFQKPHTDYTGIYDPNNIMQTDEEKFIEAIQNAKEIVTVGNAIAIWDGVVNYVNEDGGVIKRGQGKPKDGCNPLVDVYANSNESEAPHVVYGTGFEVSDREELINKMTKKAEYADEKL